MIFRPPGKLRRRRVALVRVAPWRGVSVETPDSYDEAQGPARCRELLERFAAHRLYVDDGLVRLRHTTGAKWWTARTWRGRAVAMSLDGTRVTVTSLRGALTDSQDPLGDLLVALDWLARHSVAPASIGTMGVNLWQSSLPDMGRGDGVTIGFNSKVGHAAVYGGRMGVKEVRTYSQMSSVDLVSAYVEAMRRPYARILRPVSPRTGIDPDVPGLAVARVVVPTDCPFPPLPVRLLPDVIQFQRGHVRGVWPWVELATAAAIGCDVTVERAWAPPPGATLDLFSSWVALAAEGRQLPGGAGRLLKAITNSTWGTFGMRGEEHGCVRWHDDGGDTSYSVPHPPQPMPHARTAHIAAETTARVRVRLFGALTDPDYSPPVYWDTDGLFRRASESRGMATTALPGAWRVKDRMRKVEVRAPQVYRYQCGKGCGITHPAWHYKVSGVSAAKAPDVFTRAGRRGFPFAVRGVDIVLPDGHAQELDRVKAAVSMARAVEGEMFGPGLDDGTVIA